MLSEVLGDTVLWKQPKVAQLASYIDPLCIWEPYGTPFNIQMYKMYNVHMYRSSDPCTVTCTETNICQLSASCMASHCQFTEHVTMNLICDVQLVHNTTVQTVKLYQVHTSCSHTALYITPQPTLSHCTTSYYSLHSHTALHHITAFTLTLHYVTLSPTLSHCTTSHHSLHSHTALHHTTAYTHTLHYITLQPSLSHCTMSHYHLHSHTALHHTTAYTLTLHHTTAYTVNTVIWSVFLSLNYITQISTKSVSTSSLLLSWSAHHLTSMLSEVLGDTVLWNQPKVAQQRPSVPQALPQGVLPSNPV